MRSAFLFCLVLLAGCRVEEQPAPAEPDAVAQDTAVDAQTEALEPATRGADVVTAESPDADTPLADGDAYLLRRIVLGDRACYLDLQPQDSETETRLADFGVCSQAEVEDLVGRRVRVETGQANVPAESCEGDPECTDVESVELVTRLLAAE